MRFVGWAIALVLICTLCSARSSLAAGARIVVTGSGSAPVAADRATLEVLITSVAATTKGASQDNARKVRATVDALKQAAVDETDISTTQYAVRPEMDEKKGKTTGRFVVTHRIRVQITDLDQVGELTDVVAGTGAEVRSVTFSASDLGRARQTALSEAVTQARRDAETMATAAGGALGPLVELTTQGTARPPMIGATSSVQALAVGPIDVGTRITPGEQFVNVTILATWEFRESK
jgi:uncharacterized protein YggE